MQEKVRAFCSSMGKLHDVTKDLADSVGAFLVDAFHLLALFAIGATTVWSDRKSVV